MLSRFAAFEHDCDCDVCHEPAAERAWRVTAAWMMLDADAQARWSRGYATMPRGAAVRDALAEASERRDGAAVAAELEAMRAPTS